MRALRDIRVGPAGWSYDDWRGRVFPESAGAKFDTLALVAKYFDTAEINSSFYHPPAPETARAWLRRIAHNPNFVFTATGHAVGHNGAARLFWRAGPPDRPAAITGTDVAHIENGRIKLLYVFVDPVAR